MALFSYILSQSSHCWCIERLLIFINWFCILLLCWRCLWCLGVLVEFFSSFRYKIMLFANRDHLTPSFLFVFLLFLLLVLLLKLGIPRLCWIRIERVNTFASLWIRGDGFIYSPFSMILDIDSLYISLIMLRYIPSIPSVIRAFIMKGCCCCCCCCRQRPFSTSIEIIMWFLSLLLLICWMTFNDLPMLNHPWDETDLIMVYDLFHMLLNSVCQYFIEDVCI
jgi:hypothetical protein